MSSSLPPVPINTPVTDASGRLVPVWADFFNKLFNRVGGFTADTNIELYNVASGAVLGYTPENVANKSSISTLGTSDTLYPTQHAVKTYVDSGLAGKQSALGYTAEDQANKDTDSTFAANSDTKYPSQKAVKTALALKQDTLGGSGVTAGSYTNSSITVDSRGIVTAASSGEGSSGFSTGDVKFTLKTAADSGWVMMDDGTIGDASSGASTRANADTVNLFTLLWNNVSDTYAPVSGGRGVSAAADFAAHKKISLTKVLGRAMAASGSGSGLTSRSLGQTLGEETHTLTVSEMPAHDHGGATGSTPSQQIWGNFAGAINISISAGTNHNQAGAHSHSISSQGGGAAHNVMQPTTFLNVMVCL